MGGPSDALWFAPAAGVPSLSTSASLPQPPPLQPPPQLPAALPRAMMNGAPGAAALADGSHPPRFAMPQAPSGPGQAMAPPAILDDEWEEEVDDLLDWTNNLDVPDSPRGR